MQSASRSTSAARAFDLIGVIAARGGAGVGLTELARECGMSLSSTHRYVATLVEIGVLDRAGSGPIRLGPRLITLAAGALEGDPLRAVGLNHLTRLVEATGETSHLGRFAQGQVVYVDKVECDKSIRLVSRVGARVPAHCSAMGKAILSRLPAAAAEAYIADAAERRTERTKLGAALRDEIAQVAAQGWAVDDEENETGVRCLGAAIVSREGAVLGAVSVSGPAHRFTLAACRDSVPAVTQAAAAIGAAL
ncbi:MAG: IclR family transcriptional regulator [Bifidobacteriaceae bacterium]|nr:IclR family transcriptional regulator [Bifidobacteriaceae bacterium]